MSNYLTIGDTYTPYALCRRSYLSTFIHAMSKRHLERTILESEMVSTESGANRRRSRSPSPPILSENDAAYLDSIVGEQPTSGSSRAVKGKKRMIDRTHTDAAPSRDHAANAELQEPSFDPDNMDLDIKPEPVTRDGLRIL
ncbi:hypothetical protein [Sporisorium scitamineum]|uniref:Uncharacterized protein n=1 Tax=Sporisorium scitamineum TaxID=49012 RepID=A0A0F7S2U7_9BASI|nr:hypothetical protein [Sporisorium scitamineum]